MTELVEEFKEVCKIKTNDEDLQMICESPFQILRNTISSGNMKRVRFQYLGIFKPSEAKIRHAIKGFKNQLDDKVITQEEFEDKTKLLNNIYKYNEKIICTIKG